MLLSAHAAVSTDDVDTDIYDVFIHGSVFHFLSRRRQSVLDIKPWWLNGVPQMLSLNFRFVQATLHIYMIIYKKIRLFRGVKKTRIIKPWVYIYIYIYGLFCTLLHNKCLIVSCKVWKKNRTQIRDTLQGTMVLH